MKNLLKRIGRRLTPVLIMGAYACGVSDSTWEKVRVNLIDIQRKDRQFREQMDSIGKVEGWGSAKIQELWEKQRDLDSANLIDIDRILTRYGYPPKEKVGDLTKVPFTVIQHASDSTMATYYEMILGAGLDGHLPMRDVAQYQDHVLQTEGQPQIYGTQIWIDFKKDSKGVRYDSVYLWPVRDRAQVNAKRLAVGLDSLETSLRRYGMNPSMDYLIRKSSEIPAQ